MLKSAFCFLSALCLCLSVYGSNLQCPHGCGNVHTDQRIFQIENTIKNCFEQLAVISEANDEKFIMENNTGWYRAYFTPLFKSEPTVATLSLNKRGIRNNSYTKELLFYRKWKRRDSSFNIRNEKDEQLARSWGLSLECWDEEKFANTHLGYSGYGYNPSSEGRYYIEGEYVSTQTEHYSLQSYSSVLHFFNSIRQSVIDLYCYLSTYQQFEVKIAERQLQWEINHREEFQKKIKSSRRDCYCYCENPYSSCDPCLNCRVRYAEQKIQLIPFVKNKFINSARILPRTKAWSEVASLNKLPRVKAKDRR